MWNNFNNFFSQKKSWKGKLSVLNNRNPMKNINLYKGEKYFFIN